MVRRCLRSVKLAPRIAINMSCNRGQSCQVLGQDLQLDCAADAFPDWYGCCCLIFMRSNSLSKPTAGLPSAKGLSAVKFGRLAKYPFVRRWLTGGVGCAMLLATATRAQEIGISTAANPSVGAVLAKPVIASEHFAATMVHSLFYHRNDNEAPSANLFRLETPLELQPAKAPHPGFLNLPFFSLFKRKTVREREYAHSWATLEPGFGQIYLDHPEAIYGRHGAGWQEPSCGYLKVCLKF